MRSAKTREYFREYARQWRAANPEKTRATWQRSHAKNRTQRMAATKKWRAANPDRVKAHDARKYQKRRDVIRAKRLGVSVEEVRRWLAIGQCEACRVPFKNGDGYIDHDHATGRIRGLLCNPCNLALGVALEDLSRLEGLTEYAKARVVPQVVEVIGGAIMREARKQEEGA